MGRCLQLVKCGQRENFRKRRLLLSKVESCWDQIGRYDQTSKRGAIAGGHVSRDFSAIESSPCAPHRASTDEVASINASDGVEFLAEQIVLLPRNLDPNWIYI